MIARVTDRGPVDANSYQQLRQQVLRDPCAAHLAPHCLQTCAHIDDVWRYIKRQQPPLATYAARRAYLIQQFAGLVEGSLRSEEDRPTGRSPSLDVRSAI